MRRASQPRKLLVASAGVATITLLGACEDDPGQYVTGNLVAPDPTDMPSAEAPPSEEATAVPLESAAAPEDALEEDTPQDDPEE